jgi:dTDP-4-dehydrorhamnose 3,5-epimerase
MSQFYKPECSKGIRWDDETLKISWPLKPSVISEKDSNLGTLDEAMI